MNAQPLGKIEQYQIKSSEDSVFYAFGVLVGQRYFTADFYANLNIKLLTNGVKMIREEKDTISDEANVYVQDFNKFK